MVNEIAATPAQIAVLFTSREAYARKSILAALTSAGAVATVDRIHALKVGGITPETLEIVTSPSFNGQSGRRYLGIL
jgi:hypothetical protein